MLLRLLDDVEGGFHGRSAGLLVPFVFDDMAVLRVPAGRAEHRRDADAQAAIGRKVDPAGMGDREIGERGDAGEQQFGIGDLHAIRHRLGVGPQDRHELVERGIIERGRAELVEETLVQRLARRVRVDVDEAGHDHAPAAVDGLVGLPFVAGPDIKQRAVLEGDIGAVQIDMPGSFRVPGDNDFGVLDDRDRHDFPFLPTGTAKKSAARFSPRGAREAQRFSLMSSPL